MAKELQGQKIEFLATDGVEQVELKEPWKAVGDAGAEPELLSTKEGEIQGFDHPDTAHRFPSTGSSRTPTLPTTTRSSSRGGRQPGLPQDG